MHYLTFLVVGTLLIIGADSLFWISQPAQNLCMKWVDQDPYGAWKSALICGTSLMPSSSVTNLKALGLIHLIIVSGAHLSFFEQTLLKPLSLIMPRAFRTKFILFGLITYSLAAGLQPPLVRALFQRLPSLHLSLKIGMSAMICAVFFREFSLSLLLSWSCALLITWPKVSNPFVVSILVLIGLYPLLLPLGAPDISSAFLQPLFSLFFGFFVFPLTAANLIFPLDGLVSGLWEFFFSLLSQAADFDFTLLYADMKTFPKLIYVLLLQFAHWRAEIRAARSRYQGHSRDFL